MQNHSSIVETKLQISSLGINYQKAGSDNAPPILLLHGLGTRASFWLPVIPALVSAGYQVYALDLPGFGRSDPIPGLYSPDSVGKLISTVVGALDLSSVIVVGHSMGGTMGAGFAIADPGRVKALVFVDAFGFSNHFLPISPAILYTLALPSFYYRFTRRPEKLIKPIIKSNFHVSERLRPEILELAIAENWVADLSERVKILLGMGVSIGFQVQRKAFVHALRDQLFRYGFPVLVIWGQDDAFTPVDGAYRMKSEFPEIDLSIIPDCGHVPPLEKTDEFNQELIRFLSTLR